MRRLLARSLTALAFAAAASGTSHAASLDREGDIKFGLRTYVNARVGTESTYTKKIRGSLSDPTQPRPGESETFPHSDPGALRQNRYFIEAEFDHSLDRLMQQGYGPMILLRQLPFRIKGLKYHLTFRGEGDGVYDLGPNEYSDADKYTVGRFDAPWDPELIDNPITNKRVDVLAARRRLRDHSMHRERLFQAYVEGSVGKLYARFGRQILSWGEADGFRLLDNINPLDFSFGGFLVPLDERRIPLDMLRLQYSLPSVGPISEPFLEAYAAIDDEVSFVPGPIPGSPWNPPNADKPSAVVKVTQERPARSFKNTRGGGRLVWTMWDMTLGLAHYYTMADTPRLTTRVADGFPLQGIEDGYLAEATLSAKRMQVTGGSGTFVVPYEAARAIGLSGEPVIRFEAAYFRGEPRYRQENLDPFIFHNPKYGRRNLGGGDTGNSFNFVLGIDHNQFLRFLNPSQSFIFSTQLFYKRLLDAADRKQIEREISTGEVLPIPNRLVAIVGGAPIEPIFIRHPTDQFLQTFFVTTAYRSGQIVPTYLAFYDWGGSWLHQWGVTFSYDPFRFGVDYNFLTAKTLKGGSGVSLLRDRDNVQFRIEYVI